MTPSASRTVLLFVLSVGSVLLAVAAKAEAKNGNVIQCIEEHFGREIQMGYDVVKTLAPHIQDSLESISSFAASFDQYVCRPQLQQQVAEVYHCFFNISRQCLDMLRSDATEKGNYGKTFLLFNLESYLPDPDLFEKAVQLFCVIKDVPLLCFKDEETQTYLKFCSIKEIERLQKLIDAAHLDDIFEDESELNLPWNWKEKEMFLGMDPLKSYICMGFKNLRTCSMDHTKRCPEATIKFFDKLLDFLIPPSCQSHEMRKGNADQRKSSEVHDKSVMAASPFHEKM